MNAATFAWRGSKYGIVEVRFSTKAETASLTTKILRTDKVTMSPTYKGRRSVRIHIGRLITETQLEWVIAIIVSTTEENPEIVSVSKTNSLNWSEYGIQMWLLATSRVYSKEPLLEGDTRRKFPQNVRWRPNCYLCGVTTHMRTQYPKYNPPQIQKENDTNSENNCYMKWRSEADKKGVSTAKDGEWVKPAHTPKDRHQSSRRRSKKIKLNLYSKVCKRT